MELHQDLFNPHEAGFTLLYVEDSLVNREYTLGIVSPHFSEVINANNGAQGLEIFVKRRPDLVITDIRMPVMDGITMADHIRDLDRDVPIIITSAHSDRDVLMQSIRTGITRFIMKPVNATELVQTIDELKLLILLRRRIQLQTKLIEAVLDAQDFVTVITDGESLFAMNRFSLAFTGYPDMDAFQREHRCICEFFIPEAGFLANTPDWITTVRQAAGASIQVQMTDARDGELHTFTATCSELPDFGGRFVISFIDITELERQRKDLEKLARIDPLTGVFNRHHFNTLLDFNIEKHRRYGEEQTFSILLFDIDHFKQINDQFGHLVGDTILTQFTRLIQSKIRKSDFLARWGGEEFVLLSPDTDIGSSTILAEKLRSVIEGHKFEGIDRPLTCSVGLTSYKDGDSLNSLMDRADRALYEAKNNGRNCIFPG